TFIKPGTPAQAQGGIKWADWGEDAFRRAKDEDKLILLDISATWCRWCRAMDEQVYSDPTVVALVEGKFVPVRVDADSRPDINDRYNQGGWPTVAVLAPGGEVIAGGTTMTARELVTSLTRLDAAWHSDREKYLEKIRAAEKAKAEAREKTAAAAPLSAEMPFRALSAINLFYDTSYGGFGGPEKYPMPEVLEFALYAYPKAKDSKENSPRAAIETALDGMAGGLLDGIEGGFYRYSVTPDWKNPHTEKLLSTNADLLGICMAAYQRMGAGRFKKAGESAAAYMERALYDKNTGAFFASQAADPEYYALGRDARAKRTPPPIDLTLYADANAKAVLGCLAAYRATGDIKYLKTALGAMDFVLNRLYVKGEGVAHSPGAGTAALYLADQVYAALAAGQAYQATGEPAYLDMAMDVAGILAGRFWDTGKGGFYDAAYKGEPEGLLRDREKPQAENSKAAALFMDLYHITGNEPYKQVAGKALAPFAADYVKYTYWAAPFAMGVARVIEPTYEFIVLGPKGSPGTLKLLEMSYRYDDPDRVVVPLDPSTERGKKRLDELGYEYAGGPILYVCSEKTCFPPVSPGESLRKTREYIEKSKERETGSPGREK
ncbi:MAG TPA: DUF255 domain-containing protein, partial [Nitrospirota bacterium]|nr:DUF255 domain-containing protein [Nitrospirota bacterium]